MDENEEEPECWTCGERPAFECPECADGEEYCRGCLEEHRETRHDESESDA